MKIIYKPSRTRYSFGGFPMRIYHCDEHATAVIPLDPLNKVHCEIAKSIREETKHCNACEIARKSQLEIDKEEREDEKIQREHEKERSARQTFMNSAKCFFLRHKYEVVGYFSDGDPIQDCKRCGKRVFRIFTEPSYKEMREFQNIINSQKKSGS